MPGLTAHGAGPSTWFQRYLLPGFAFKAVVIGGGYATGRELAEFFLPSGPWGGVIGMGLAALIWSVVCAATFLFARLTGSLNYRDFFRQLLGPGWWAFEIAFVLLLFLILAVFGAAAGAVGEALFGWPPIIGTLLLVAGIAGFTALGNDAVEALFKWVSFLLYGVYGIFLVLALNSFGRRILTTFAGSDIGPGWAMAGLTYSGYNIVGAVAILPIVRHFRHSRDAITAGLLAGPLAMAPALLFFVSMAAWPDIGGALLPSDFLLERMNLPVFRYAFQAMIFAALLESGTGSLNAFNERIAGAVGPARYGTGSRLLVSMMVLICAVFLADRFGLVALIASGYRFLSWAFLAAYVLPLMTIGVWRLWQNRQPVMERIA
ncbi:YkvI family membrane protein [Sandarakinorhabdus limnophila]|uniref:YkvI family membrane protein n=1 Tax=Sandarakinorhabdus limnophila TaxID=210512 RepID=UPI0026E9E1E0|nr:hypothetical protein [Sandarakinorhabdus limnophila]